MKTKILLASLSCSILFGSAFAVKITPLSGEYQEHQQEEVQNYTTGVNLEKCNSYELWNAPYSSGSVRMKEYQQANECERRNENKLSMPKSLACKLPDGFYNTKLQFNWDYRNKYLSSSHNNGFHKFNNKLLYSIYINTESSTPEGASFIYSCSLKKAKEIKDLTINYNLIDKIYSTNKGFIFGFQNITYMFGYQGFSIFYTNGNKFININLTNDINSNGQLIESKFSGFNNIHLGITKYMEQYGSGKYLKDFGIETDKYLLSDFLKGDIIANYNLKELNKNGTGILKVTMPGFIMEFDIDVFNRTIQ